MTFADATLVLELTPHWRTGWRLSTWARAPDHGRRGFRPGDPGTERGKRRPIQVGPSLRLLSARRPVMTWQVELIDGRLQVPAQLVGVRHARRRPGQIERCFRFSSRPITVPILPRGGFQTISEVADSFYVALGRITYAIQLSPCFSYALCSSRLGYTFGYTARAAAEIAPAIYFSSLCSSSKFIVIIVTAPFPRSKSPPLRAFLE